LQTTDNAISTLKLFFLFALFIFSGSATQRELRAPRPQGFVITQNDAPQSVGFIWTSDQLISQTST
jgi:hypothetical protein